MTKKYTLKNPKLRNITSINKDVYECGAIDEEGNIIEKVTLWKGDWLNATIENDVTVSADLIVSEKNGYKNFTLKPERTNTLGRGGNGIKAAQERKAVDIAKAQERKNESISYFNSLNCAITFVKEFKQEMGIKTEKDAYNAVLRLRDDFIAEWQKYEVSDYKDKHIPF